MNVTNHTAINVAALLHDNLGAARTYRLELEQLELDDALLASPVEGTLVLTRLDEEILVDARIETSVKIECQRCLEPFTQPVRARMSESFLMSTDVRTGAEVDVESEAEELYFIAPNHEIDILEPLRQEIIVSLPMRPLCDDACSGIEMETDESTPSVDPRFSALADLLPDDMESIEAS